MVLALQDKQDDPVQQVQRDRQDQLACLDVREELVQQVKRVDQVAVEQQVRQDGLALLDLQAIQATLVGLV